MKKFSFILHFPVSRSRHYGQVIMLAAKFDNFSTGDKNAVSLTIKEVFEKWDYFNSLFWKVVDWKGCILEYDSMGFHSHSDKTRLFYSLQLAHVKYMHYLEDVLSKLDQVQRGEKSMEEISNMTEEQMNALIEYHLRLKSGI